MGVLNLGCTARILIKEKTMEFPHGRVSTFTLRQDSGLCPADDNGALMRSRPWVWFLVWVIQLRLGPRPCFSTRSAVSVEMGPITDSGTWPPDSESLGLALGICILSKIQCDSLGLKHLWFRLLRHISPERVKKSLSPPTPTAPPPWLTLTWTGFRCASQSWFFFEAPSN